MLFHDLIFSSFEYESTDCQKIFKVLNVAFTSFTIRKLHHALQPHERRMISSVGNNVTSSSGYCLSKRENNCSVAMRPTASVGAETVVSGGVKNAENPRSSKPTTATSWGT